MTHLVLGIGQPDVQNSVAAALEARGHDVLRLSSPFSPPAALNWWLDNLSSRSELRLSDGRVLRDQEIESVLVAPGAWVSPEGWQERDLAYVESEAAAALLAWLWSLPCPVINRCPPPFWFDPAPPFATWRPYLRAAGVPAIAGGIASEVSEARSLAPAGATYTPLTIRRTFRIADDPAWESLTQLRGLVPLAMVPEHCTTCHACVAGPRVIWSPAPDHAGDLEAGLQRLAQATGLVCFTVRFADTSEGAQATSAAPLPRLAGFAAAAANEVITALADLLTGVRAERGQH